MTQPVWQSGTAPLCARRRALLQSWLGALFQGVLAACFAALLTVSSVRAQDSTAAADNATSPQVSTSRETTSPEAPPPPPASATAPASSLPSRESASPAALEAFRRARGAYAEGRYRDAAHDLEIAMEEDPNSSTLAYNLARVYELMGELEQALRYYARYEELLPQEQARELDRARATMRRLEGARASQVTVERPQEVVALRELPGLVLVHERGVADATFWITASASVLLLAAGGTFGILALENRDQADNFVLGRDGVSQQRSDRYAQSETFALVSDITLAAGGAALIGAVMLYLLREQTVARPPLGSGEEDNVDEPSSPQVQAFVDPLGRSAGIWLGGSF